MKKKVNNTNSGVVTKSKSELLAEKTNWFEPVDLDKSGVTKLKKSELIHLVNLLNKQMVDSSDNWDGG